MKLFYILIFNILFQTVLANHPDSLENELQFATTDTAKVMAYNRFARSLMTGQERDYEKALKYAQQGLILAKQANFDKGCAELLRTVGNACLYMNDYDKASEYYREAVNICEKIQDINGIALNYYNIALIYNIQSKYYYELELLQKAALAWKQIGYSGRIITVNKGIVSLLESIGEFQLAMEYAEEALNISIETGNRMEEAILYDILAGNSKAMGDVGKMEEYYKKSLNIFEELDEQVQLARVTHNYALNIYSDNPETSIDLLQKSAVMFEKMSPNDKSLYEIYNNIANLFVDENRIDSVRYYKEKALEKAVLSDNSQTMAEAYITTGNFYMNNGNIKRAEKDFRNAYDIALKKGLIDKQSNALSGLSSVNYLKGDYKTAAEYLQKHKIVNDSLNMEEINKNIQQMNSHFDFEKDMNEQRAIFNAQLEHQQQAIKHQKNIVSIISFALLFTTVLLVFIIRNNKQRMQANAKLEQQRHDILRINDELQKSHHELSKYKDSLEEMVKEQTDKIRQSEIQLHTISDNLPRGCIYQKHIYRDGKAIINYISSTSEKWLGISAEAVMNDIKMLHQRIVPEDFETKQKLENECIVSLSPFSCEFRMLKEDGEIWLLENAMPRKDKDNESLWDGIVVDITDRKKFEKELIEAKEHAEESDRLKSAFLANMSHEIRTPMNGIVGFLSFMEREDLMPEKRNAYANIIRNNVQQLLKLIEDIIDISKIDSRLMTLHPVRFDLNSMMDELEIYFQDFIIKRDKKLALELDRSAYISPCFIEYDHVRLRQILSNLIGNAIKFTDKGYVRFGYNLNENCDKLYFFVEDTGTGISKSKQKDIFERFKQAYDESKYTLLRGTGLGLSISKNLTELMGGQIGVESEEGIGSTFYFTLPYFNNDFFAKIM